MLPLTHAVLAGEPVMVPGCLDVPHSLTYLPDLVQTLVTLGATEAAFGRAWHVPNPPAISLGSFVEALARAAGQPVSAQPIPAEALAQAADHDPAARELAELAYIYFEPFVVDVSAFATSFGAAATPLEAALAPRGRPESTSNRSGKLMSRRIAYAYWGLTAAFCLLVTVTGLGDLTGAEVVVQDLLQLGYPAHLATFLGVAKLLGVAALLAPGLPRLKEWAYAGYAFDFIGAIYSALALGIVDSDVAMAAGSLALLAAAYIAYRLAERAGVPPGLVRARPRGAPVAGARR